MQIEEFLNVVSECDILKNDIEDVRSRVPLTRTEGHKLDQALAHVDKAKSILSVLFPAIKCLQAEVREELQAELGEVD